ncbi:MAG: ligase-associated DNA damage response endonuclease PdeM [Cyanobacteria bacterium REEB67]|nr:ligase-associated DNA damage response endonuclease PdeM [Cyanobacteria bacterium REEB67]
MSEEEKEEEKEEGEIRAQISMAGQDVILLPQKAMYLVESETLVVADVHVGKGASFRSRRYFAPDGVTCRDLAILSTALIGHGARRLMILGDLVHAQDGLTAAETALFDDFRQKHANIDMVLVLGNHDRKAKVPASWQLMQVRGDMHEGPFIFAHEYVVSADTKSGYVLSGHIHPSVVLHGKGKQSERLPCFWVRRKYAVLPSFGVFTGSFTIRPSQLDKIYVVAQDAVIEIET